MRLADDVTEARIAREGRCLVEDRFAHGGAHGLARLSVTKFKVLADLGVRHILETLRAVSGMREKRREFEERETVRCEHVERIA